MYDYAYHEGRVGATIVICDCFDGKYNGATVLASVERTHKTLWPHQCKLKRAIIDSTDVLSGSFLIAPVLTKKPSSFQRLCNVVALLHLATAK